MPIADFVHLGRQSQQLALLLFLAGAVGEDGAGAAHPLDVTRGLVVAELGGQREAVDRLFLGEAQSVLDALDASDGPGQLGGCALGPPALGSRRAGAAACAPSGRRAG